MFSPGAAAPGKLPGKLFLMCPVIKIDFDILFALAVDTLKRLALALVTCATCIVYGIL